MSKIANFGTNQINQILSTINSVVSYLPKNHDIKMIILTISGDMYCITDFNNLSFKPIKLAFDGNNPTIEIGGEGFTLFSHITEHDSAEEIVCIMQNSLDASEAIIAYHSFF